MPKNNIPIMDEQDVIERLRAENAQLHEQIKERNALIEKLLSSMEDMAKRTLALVSDL